MNDLSSANALRSGDIRFFEEVYRMYYSSLFNYAFQLIKSKNTAEDIVNDVFLKLWENREQITIETSLKSYLFKSIYHHSINTLKHIQVQEKYKSFFKHHLTLDENDPEYPLVGVIKEEINSIVQRTIDQLPAQCRKIFILSRVEHLEHEEIAQRLNISVHTVREQVRRALGKLRINLGEFLSILLLM